MADNNKARTAPADQASPDPLAEVEAMIVRLTELREPGKDRRADYQAVIDRFDALAYRLRAAAGPGRTVGMPTKPRPPVALPPRDSGRSPVPVKLPQTALPLGLVIVRARKPRR